MGWTDLWFPMLNDVYGQIILSLILCDFHAPKLPRRGATRLEYRDVTYYIPFYNHTYLDHQVPNGPKYSGLSKVLCNIVINKEFHPFD